MQDRSSRPSSQPNRTPQPLVRKVVHLRWKQRLGPVAIADRVGLARAAAGSQGGGSRGSRSSFQNVFSANRFRLLGPIWAG
jgi:hypothetical protein